MCGPLALSLPLGEDRKKAIGSWMFYQTGRLLTYVILGVIVASLGLSLKMAGFQQSISLIIGLVLVLTVIFPRIFKKLKLTGLERAYFQLRSAFMKGFNKHNRISFLWMGALNGLLPCGLIYLAMSASLATADIQGGAVFMLGFGLGTLPLFWIINFARHMVPKKKMNQLRKYLPVFTAFFGILLILRGCDLGIPFISPEIKIQGASAIIECH
ncbi:MAG: sulfite exporter TauE/SafE family protein [Flavobacteriales bacterium]|nr:sulfite exporter TauE/SafE family protein [Flavobacteriales bacterium]